MHINWNKKKKIILNNTKTTISILNIFTIDINGTKDTSNHYNNESILKVEKMFFKLSRNLSFCNIR